MARVLFDGYKFFDLLGLLSEAVRLLLWYVLHILLCDLNIVSTDIDIEADPSPTHWGTFPEAGKGLG